MKKLIIPALLCLAPLQAGAQTYFDLFPLDPYFSSETILLDPHYDATGRVTRYSMGDIMQMVYRYGADGKIEGKKASVWDKGEYGWQELLDISYGYEGKKLSRTASTLRGETLVTRRIADGGRSRVDTIYTVRGFPELDEKYNQRINTLVYRQKSGLIDSCVTVYESEELDGYAKEVYAYDRSKRPVKAETYWKIGKRDWRKLQTLYMEYNGDRTDYVYIADISLPNADLYANMLGYDTWEECLGSGDENYTREYIEELLAGAVPAGTEISRLSIGVDGRGRVASRRLFYKGNLISDATYSYDDQGRTSGEHTLNIDNIRDIAELVPVLGMTGGIYDLGVYIHYTVGYMADGSRSATYHFKMKDVSRGSYYYEDEEDNDEADEDNYLSLRLRTICRENADGSMAHFQMDRWDSDNDFDDSWRADFTYGDDGRRVERLVSRMLDEEDGWENYGMAVTLYDEAGRKVGEEQYRWLSGGWNTDSKQTFVYDEHGEICRDEYLGYGWDDEVYAGTLREYTRDGRGRLLSEKVSSWKEGSWYPDQEELHGYDDAANTSSYEKIEYDWHGEISDGTEKIRKVYDSEGNTVKETEYVWDGETEAWQGVRKVERTEEQAANGANGVETSYGWRDGRWVPEAKYVALTGEGYMYGQRIYFWDEDTAEWILSQREVTYMDGEYVVEEAYTSGSMSDGGRENCFRFRRTPDHDFLETIYLARDGDNGEWYDSLSIVRIYEGTREIYTHRRYDRESGQWFNYRKVDLPHYTDDDPLITHYEWVWDEGTADWVYNRKVEVTGEIYGYEGTNISYLYDMEGGKWVPHMMRSMVEHITPVDVLFSVWDGESGSWRNMIMFPGLSGHDYYKWNISRNEWEPEEGDKNGYNFFYRLNEVFDLEWIADPRY